ncbi:hypothetical protein KIPB_000540 [Kipferlia bialata]|uniref:Uncharacterized protein n=1 Tax=Kipferlia bialata TaxID=797122 RepID=A0A9K3CPD7_9EUKA|nr:hypothetical protein KIPB_000540 [Kipferlia bialata]|eukprot:g540.t1
MVGPAPGFETSDLHPSLWKRRFNTAGDLLLEMERQSGRQWEVSADSLSVQCTWNDSHCAMALSQDKGYCVGNFLTRLDCMDETVVCNTHTSCDSRGACRSLVFVSFTPYILFFVMLGVYSLTHRIPFKDIIPVAQLSAREILVTYRSRVYEGIPFAFWVVEMDTGESLVQRTGTRVATATALTTPTEEYGCQYPSHIITTVGTRVYMVYGGEPHNAPGIGPVFYSLEMDTLNWERLQWCHTDADATSFDPARATCFVLDECIYYLALRRGRTCSLQCRCYDTERKVWTTLETPQFDGINTYGTWAVGESCVVRGVAYVLLDVSTCVSGAYGGARFLLAFSALNGWTVDSHVHMRGGVGRAFGDNHTAFGDTIVSCGLWGSAGTYDVISGEVGEWTRPWVEATYPIPLPLSVGQAYVCRASLPSTTASDTEVHGLVVMEADASYMYPDGGLKWAG